MAEARPALFESYDKLAAEDKERFYKTLGAFGFSVILVSCFFLPFVSFTIGDMKYSLSSMDAVFGSLDIGGAIVGLSPVMRAAALLPPILTVFGITALWLKWQTISAVSFVLSALCPVIFTITSPALEGSVSKVSEAAVTTDYGVGYILTLLLSVICCLLALWSKSSDYLGESIFKTAAMVSVGMVAVITLYMIIQGTPAIAKIGVVEFLFGTEWKPTAEEPQFGILKMVLATLTGTAGAIIIGVPVGLLTAVFLSELAPRPAAAVIKPAVELLAGIPSVVYGLFGIKVIVPLIRKAFPWTGTTGEGLLAVIIILSIMILPTIINITITSLKAVNPSFKEASLALGATQISTIFKVQIPSASSGILSGVILGVGRAIGETMAIIMVAGNTVNFSGLFDSVRPLTIGFVFEMGYASGLHRQALYSIGLVLFIFIMIVNISFNMVSKKNAQK